MSDTEREFRNALFSLAHFTGAKGADAAAVGEAWAEELGAVMGEGPVRESVAVDLTARIHRFIRELRSETNKPADAQADSVRTFLAQLSETMSKESVAMPTATTPRAPRAANKTTAPKTKATNRPPSAGNNVDASNPRAAKPPAGTTPLPTANDSKSPPPKAPPAAAKPDAKPAKLDPKSLAARTAKALGPELAEMSKNDRVRAFKEIAKRKRELTLIEMDDHKWLNPVDERIFNVWEDAADFAYSNLGVAYFSISYDELPDQKRLRDALTAAEAAVKGTSGTDKVKALRKVVKAAEAVAAATKIPAYQRQMAELVKKSNLTIEGLE